MKKNAPRAKGLASILAISTANPENFIEQTTFPDFYFRATNTEHLVDLKKKFQRICDKTTIRKRHFTWNQQLLAANPCLIAFMANSFNIRQEISIREVPKLGAEVATTAINEWGQPKSRITHLIFCTTTVANLPGFDCQLVNTLALNPNVERVMLYEQGCFGGGTTLRLAKCLAESSKGARVLVVCVETSAMIIRGPVEEHPEDLVTQALFADGASALIVGADPDEEAHERASFVIFSASQFLLPNSENAITASLSEGGFKVNIHRDIPNIISRNLGKCLEEVFTPLDILDWNSIFWVLHPGGRAIIDQIEERLGLKTEKLLTSRHVLAEYGNMISVSVLFVLDAMRKRSAKEGKSTSGEGFEWGVLFGFGPGITVETVVLKSVPL